MPARQNAVTMEPALPKSSSSAKVAASSTLALTPLERIFNRRWLNYFGEHAILPIEKVKPTAKATDSASPDAESTFAKLHTNLHAAWSLRDAHKLEAVASKHLMQQATSGIPVIDPFTRTLYEFFKARGCEGTGAELIALVGGMTTQQINDYLTSSAQLVSELKTQAFAAMVNGTLSQQGIDLLLAIKSIGAFQLIAAAILKYGKEPSKIPVKMICAMLDADICFPEWSFDVDPCRWTKPDDAVPNPRGNTGVIQTWPGSASAVDAAAHASAMAVSPMKQRMEREARVSAQRSAIAQAVSDEATSAMQLSDTTEQYPKPSEDPKPPKDCNCEEDLNPPCLPPDPCCAKINYYVTDTLVLRDKTKRYVPSDLAYIENVVIGETRTREHSFAKTIEDYAEEEVTTTKSEERDHQVTERFSVQNEIEKNVKIDANSPVYDPTSSEQTMRWKITLNRPFEFNGQNALNHADASVLIIASEDFEKFKIADAFLQPDRKDGFEYGANHPYCQYFQRKIKPESLFSGLKITNEHSPYGTIKDHLFILNLLSSIKTAKPKAK